VLHVQVRWGIGGRRVCKETRLLEEAGFLGVPTLELDGMSRPYRIVFSSPRIDRRFVIGGLHYLR
jgi:hypothetical protein